VIGRRRRELRGAIVVITGASSGIGREAARQFAAKGARVVLAARSAGSLEEAAAECRREGAEALAVPTDVSDAAAVDELARRAVEAFGRIDVWVNNAAVLAFGRFEDIPPEAYRRVLEVNLLGEINGARAALPHFRRQRAGTLINLSSLWARVRSPFVSPYVVSKSGAAAFSACLRQEVRDMPGIRICVVDPQSVDTPLFQQAANYLGLEGRPVPPITTPERVAEAIVDCAERPRPEVIVAWSGRGLAIAARLAPRLVERLSLPVMEAVSLGDAPADPTAGNLFEPRPERNAVRGGWRERKALRYGAPLVAAGAGARALAGDLLGAARAAAQAAGQSRSSRSSSAAG
jgi:NAD(P)-dependent dehydrogenase (short-subunit alcohol dehydrogenase family)